MSKVTKITTASPLSRKAVLVSVNISSWTARKLDKRVTDETNHKYHATKDAGRYNKLLIAGQHLADIVGTASKARHRHYAMTQPWVDEGPRILANALYAKFTDEFRVLKREFNDAADRFAADFPQFVAERKRELNGLFNAADYPDASEIRSKFKFDITILPFPDAADFRSDLDEDTVAEIRAQLEITSKDAVSKAMEHTGQRIIETVGRMADKLREFKTVEGKCFRDSLVENVRELADLLPAFNLTGDNKLTAITDRIVKELCAEEADVLRENDAVRKTVRKSADEIVAAVSALFG
jgi:hypothetical protein